MIQLHHLRVRWNSSLANDQRLWQASAHLLALTLHKRYGSDLLLVKSFISNGFHLDFYIAQGNDSCANNKDAITRFLGRKQVQISQSELKSLQKEFLKNTNLIFETKEYVQSEALGKLPLMLKQNVQSVQEKPVKLVKHGSFYDLFVNPFAIPKDIKAAYLHSTGAIKFHHQNQEFTLTRISGISFDSRQKMVDYKQNLADAEKRNHRKIGNKLKLFTFHEFSPGAPFFLPHGTRMVNKLKEYLCGIYVKYGFEEVITPLVYSKELWEISGHWDNYKNDMFTLSCCDHEDKDQIHGLKPMNCPAHCLIFSSSTKSYRELPVRYAEFSPLHRYFNIYEGMKHQVH
jgi:threonyl-tRNA synthetase